MSTVGGVLLYAGLLGAAAAVVCLVRSRPKALILFLAAVLSFVAGVFVPVTETRIEPRRTWLDDFIPVFQFSETHQLEVAAGRERIDAAIRTVQPDEIRYYRALTFLRRVAKPGRPGILNPPAGRPILDTFTSGGFPLAADEPGRELVLAHTSLVKIGFGFRIDELAPSRCLVTTETRVYATGSHRVRGFAAYWRIIQPGSALIRRYWLRAIQNRAETAERAKSDPLGLI